MTPMEAARAIRALDMQEFTPAEGARIDHEIATTEAVVPTVLPAEWERIKPDIGGAVFLHRHGMKVIVRVEVHEGHDWLHVSFSRRNKCPSYADASDVKALFVGRGRKAIMVLPAESEHVNLHPFCLHWYSPLGRDPLPDFRRVRGGVVGI